MTRDAELKRAARRRKVGLLKKDGVSFRQVGDMAGCSPSTAWLDRRAMDAAKSTEDEGAGCKKTLWRR